MKRLLIALSLVTGPAWTASAQAVYVPPPVTSRTTTQRTAQSWPSGVLLYDTNLSSLWVGDGATTGGRATTAAASLAIGNPLAGGTAGRVLYEGAGPVLSDDANLVYDSTNHRLGVGTSAPGATLDLGPTGTLKGGPVTVNYDGPLGGPDTTWVNGSIFRQCVSAVFGVNDLFFQGLALANGYFYIEDWEGLGLALGTGNSSQPILLRPARTTVATVSSSGTIALVVAPAATDVPLALKGTAGQTADLSQAQDSTGAVLSRIYAGGGYQPASYADAAAPNNCLYYSTTSAKLTFKDPNGVVHPLY